MKTRLQQKVCRNHNTISSFLHTLMEKDENPFIYFQLADDVVDDDDDRK